MNLHPLAVAQEARTRLVEQVHTVGFMPVCRSLGLQRETVARVCAGIPVQAKTMRRVARALGLVGDEGEQPTRPLNEAPAAPVAP